jgi:hypothetical protein
MADTFQYDKKRRLFGNTPHFEDTSTQLVGSIAPDSSQHELYEQRNPNTLILDNIPSFSQH